MRAPQRRTILQILLVNGVWDLVIATTMFLLVALASVLALVIGNLS